MSFGQHTYIHIQREVDKEINMNIKRKDLRDKMKYGSFTETRGKDIKICILVSVLETQ
jgi:hypothetical protein